MDDNEAFALNHGIDRRIHSPEKRCATCALIAFQGTSFSQEFCTGCCYMARLLLLRGGCDNYKQGILQWFSTRL